MSDRRIFVDYLARAEGEGAIDVVIGPNGEIKETRWKMFEPMRFFEAIGIGRRCEEIPEIAQRICGICPHPHHFSTVQAIERAMGVQLSEQTVLLRKLFLLGDVLQSNALHLYFLAAPDFVGYDSVIAMAANPELLPLVKKALELKRLGNDMSVLLGGHEIMFRSSVIGGFTKVPETSDLRKTKERLKAAKEFALETVNLAATLAAQPPYPEYTRKCEHVSLHSEDEYALYDGRLISTEGLDIPNWDYRHWIIEEHVPGCNCKHATIKGRDSFLVGPLARVNNNFRQLSADAQAAAFSVNFKVPEFNPFMSIVARAIEIVHAIDGAIEKIDQIGQTRQEEPRYQVQAGEGYAVTEAPRGICCHGVRVDKNGIVEMWDATAPTARNVRNAEKDLAEFVPRWLHLSDSELTLMCEMTLRNYDPCQSCATHAFKVNLRRA